MRDFAQSNIEAPGESTTAQWSAPKGVFEHKSFTRLWVHQEAILATHCTVFFQCETCPYLDLLNFAFALHKGPYQLPNPPDDEIYWEFCQVLERVQWRRVNSKKTTGGQSQKTFIKYSIAFIRSARHSRIRESETSSRLITTNPSLKFTLMWHRL